MTQVRPFWLHLFLAAPLLLHAESAPPDPPPGEEPPMFNTRNPKRPTYRPPTEKVTVLRPEDFFAPAPKEERKMPDLGPGLRRDTNIDSFLPPDPNIVQPPRSPYEDSEPAIVVPRGAVKPKRDSLTRERTWEKDEFLGKTDREKEGIKGLDELSDLTLASERAQEEEARSDKSGKGKGKKEEVEDKEAAEDDDDSEDAFLAGDKPSTPGFEPPKEKAGEPNKAETPQVGFVPVIPAEGFRNPREVPEGTASATAAIDARGQAMELTASGRNALREREAREQGADAFAASRKSFDSISAPHLAERQGAASAYSLNAISEAHRAEFAAASARAVSPTDAPAPGAIPDLSSTPRLDGPRPAADPPLGRFAPVEPGFTFDAPPARISGPALPLPPVFTPPAAVLPGPLGPDPFQIRSGMDRLPGAPSGRFDR